MFKKVAFAAAGIALLVSPLLASADTASELQARISTLLAQIAQLQQQLNSLQTTTTIEPTRPTIDPAPPSRICPQIVRNLEQGISGNDVKEVQTYLGVSQTGYFGPMTAKAVAAFQADEGLTQVGIVGPQTRAAFARRCGWGGVKPAPNSGFSASPQSGAAPLTVAFQANLGHSSAPGKYRIDFGDGQSGEPGSLVGCPTVFGGGECPDIRGASHTYTANGTYTATLSNSVQSCGGMDCVVENTLIGTVTIRVGGSTTGGPKLAPQSDTAGVIGAPVSIIGTGFTPGNTNNVFFGNPSVPGGPTLAAANLAPMSSGSEGYQQLFFTIPSYIAVGMYPVSVANANGSSGTNDTNGNPVTYWVRTGPTISSISPSPASVGSTITISGKGFDQQLVNVDILSTTGQEMQVTGATPTYNGTQVSIVLSAGRVPAGQYLVSVRNVGPGTPFGGVASRATSLTVTGSETRPTGITVVSPNGGERWDHGSLKNITWNDGRQTFVAVYYNVYLDRYIPPCTSWTCPMLDQMYYPPVKIARNVSGHSFEWVVGEESPGVFKADAGTYKVRVCDSEGDVSCDSSDQPFTIVDPAYENNRPPKISSFTGPTSLTVGQKGTWVVQASDPEGKKLTYSYSWCDVTNGASGVCSAQAIKEGGETTNAFTTDFPSAGTYKVSVNVSDDVGKSTQASATVAVTGAAGGQSLVSISVDGQTTITVPEGTHYTLAWSSQNVTSCTMYYARSNGAEPVTSSNPVVANTSDQARMSNIVAYTLTCQSVNGVVSKTATVFKETSPAPTFSAWPSSGVAPLTSHFTISGASSPSSYSVNFGDGSSDYNWKADTEAPNTYFMSHTFQSAGTYTATLMYQPPSVPCSAPPGAACMMVMPTQQVVGTATITVTGGSAACEVTDLYAESVPGYVYYNLFMKVRNLPSASDVGSIDPISITGADSWNNLTFTRLATTGDNVTTLQASQTIGGVGLNYIMERRFVIKPVSIGTLLTMSCTPMGGGGVAYPVPPPLYPTSGVGGTSGSSGTNMNLANALSALESALKAIIAKLGQ